jgi:hypothetical protein
MRGFYRERCLGDKVNLSLPSSQTKIVAGISFHRLICPFNWRGYQPTRGQLHFIKHFDLHELAGPARTLG